MYIEIAEQIIKFTDLKKSKDRVLKSIEIMIDNYLKNEEKMEKNILDKVTMNDVEKDKLIEGLKRNAFSLSNTAKDLGMSRTTLWRKLKKFNNINRIRKYKMKKTNAIRELEIHKIEHIVREYEVDEEHLDAVSVALKTNEDITRVFKTLVLLNEKRER